MKKFLFKGLLAAFLLTFASTNYAQAVRPVGGGGGGAKTPLGIDVSFPQCGKNLPTNHAFGIVGVNGGTAIEANSCLASQLVWASKAIGGTNQPLKQVYVNTANPGEVIHLVNTWPKTALDSNGNTVSNPYGNGCTGANDLACSWLYGWNRSIYTESVFKEAAGSVNLSAEVSEYVWWMDVETMNTWQSGSSEALAKNSAAIEGFAAYYQSKGAKVGLYSTAVQWDEITGTNLRPNSNLNGLDNWRPGGASQKTAEQACRANPLTTNGRVVMTQFISKGLDYNVSCIN